MATVTITVKTGRRMAIAEMFTAAAFDQHAVAGFGLGFRGKYDVVRGFKPWRTSSEPSLASANVRCRALSEPPRSIITSSWLPARSAS